MTNRDPVIIKAGNDVIDRLEALGESVLFLDGYSPYAISILQKDEKIYRKAILVQKNMINQRGNPRWQTKKQIQNYLKLGFNQVVLVSIDSNTGRQSIVNYNSKGIMAGKVR